MAAGCGPTPTRATSFGCAPCRATRNDGPGHSLSLRTAASRHHSFSCILMAAIGLPGRKVT